MKEEELKKEFMQLPLIIYNKRMEWLATSEEYHTIKERLETIHDDSKLEVLEKSDDTGKKIYTNDFYRKKQTDKMLACIPEYVRDKERADFLEIDIKRTAYELEHKKNRFEMLKVFFTSIID